MIKAIEKQINEKLREHAKIRIYVKKIYQYICWLFSVKEKASQGVRRVTDSKFEHLYGYYDTCPWDATGRYLLTLRVQCAYKNVCPDEEAEIGLIDTKNDYQYKKIAVSRSWNVQQGCMLQWLGPDFLQRIIYNDFRNGSYCSVIYNVSTGQEKVILFPVYSVSLDGKTALSLDFSRLHRLRPGYGYANVIDKTEGLACPDISCIWKVNLDSGEVIPLLSYKDLNNFEHRPEMDGAEHKVNHIMINPSGTRFMFLHRWIKNNNKYTRLITANLDGSELYNLSDDDMVSHCYWKDDTTVLAWARKRNVGDKYFLMKDKSREYRAMWDGFLTSDGHPSYSPDGMNVLTDTYPDRQRMARVYTCDAMGEQVKEIARVFMPFRYDNDTRCDLHPRWSRDGKQICFDAAFEGKRQIYIVDNLNDVSK